MNKKLFALLIVAILAIVSIGAVNAGYKRNFGCLIGKYFSKVLTNGLETYIINRKLADAN